MLTLSFSFPFGISVILYFCGWHQLLRTDCYTLLLHLHLQESSRGDVVMLYLIPTVEGSLKSLYFNLYILPASAGY